MIDVELARRVAVRAQLLDGSATSVLDTVRRLGFLQMDPIATVATPQQLVLFSRLGPFDTTELDRLLWDERKLFEYDAFIYPIEDLPLVRARMAKRRRANSLKRDLWVRDFLKENARFHRHILRELERNGPLLSRDLQHDEITEREDHRWWGNRPTRLMLDILAVRGEIGVAGRVGKQRLWDLGSRVFPATETIPWREAERELERRRRRSLGVWREKASGRHTRRPGRSRARPRHGPLPLRPADPRPRPRRVPVRLPLPARDVRPEGEAGVRLLRAADPPRRPIVGRVEPRFDRKTGTLEVLGAWGDTSRLDEALAEVAAFVGADTIKG